MVVTAGRLVDETLSAGAGAPVGAESAFEIRYGLA
jgi:hypothetical protein